jgi:hypothetical protein
VNPRDRIDARTRASRSSATWIALLVMTTSCGAAAPKQAVAAPSMPSQPYAEEAVVLTSSAGSAAPAAAPAAESMADSGAELMSSEVDVATTATATARASASAAPPPPQPQQPLAQAPSDVPAEAQAILQREHRVITGTLELTVERVAETAATIRGHVESIGGRVMSEQLGGDVTSRFAQLQVKVPPAQVDAFLAWIEKTGDLRGKQLQSTDVSRQLFDQVIALDNLQRTLDRMRALLDRQGLSMQEILAIEQEMTRLRGEIERLKGEKRFLEHQVAQATLTILLRQREDAVFLGQRSEPKLYPGPRLSSLYLFDADGRTRLRLGGGAAVHLYERWNLELDVFADPDDTGNAVLATMGGDIYSDFLGRGRRRFLNPYLGMRLGIGYLDRTSFAFGASAGVELFKHEYVLVDLNVRAMGLAGKGGLDTALVSGAAVVFAF